MAHIVQCYEPQARPPQVSLTLETGDSFSVFLLTDTVNRASLALRNTVMRRPEEAPPGDAIFLFSAMTTEDGATMRIRKVNRKVPVDLRRPEMDSLVTMGMEFDSGSRFRVSLPGAGTVNFGLQYAAQVVQGAKASVGGGGAKRAVSNMATLLWIVPTAMAIFSSPLSRVVASGQKFAKKLGISPGILMLFIGALVPIIACLVLAFIQHRAAAAAKDDAEQAHDQLEVAEAGLEAALAAEAACVAEREEVVTELADHDAKRELMAEIALATPLALTVAIERGGPRMGGEDVLGIDQQYMTDLQELVVLEMQRQRGGSKEAKRCLSYDGVLGHDLPRFTLLWHPDPNLVCPMGYNVVEANVDRMGSWGISARAAEEFGGSQPKPEGTTGPLTDLRMADRWSSHILANGMRAVLGALLGADTEERPPVSPGQAHMWGMAIWDAYNAMPTPAEGVLNEPVEVCVEDMITNLARSSTPAVPGQPVLPDISLVARGEQIPAVPPTAGCPWQSNSLQTGAQSAVRAVSHMANLSSGDADEAMK